MFRTNDLPSDFRRTLGRSLPLEKSWISRFWNPIPRALSRAIDSFWDVWCLVDAPPVVEIFRVLFFGLSALLYVVSVGAVLAAAGVAAAAFWVFLAKMQLLHAAGSLLVSLPLMYSLYPRLKKLVQCTGRLLPPELSNGEMGTFLRELREEIRAKKSEALAVISREKSKISSHLEKVLDPLLENLNKKRDSGLATDFDLLNLENAQSSKRKLTNELKNFTSKEDAVRKAYEGPEALITQLEGNYADAIAISGIGESFRVVENAHREQELVARMVDQLSLECTKAASDLQSIISLVEAKNDACVEMECLETGESLNVTSH